MENCFYKSKVRTKIKCFATEEGEVVLLPSVRPSFRRMGSEKRRLPGSVGAQSPLLIPPPSLFTYGPERAMCATIAEEDASFVTYPSSPPSSFPRPQTCH